MAKPVAWSYSALNSFETCAYRHYRTKVLKDVQDPPGEAALEGQDAHKALELRLLKGKPLSRRFARHEPIVQKVERIPGEIQPEQQICLNRNMDQVTWFSREAWLRVIIDVSIINGRTGVALDWKTGKRKEDIDQLMLFAGTMMAIHTQLEEVYTGYVWLKDKKIDKDYFTPDDSPRIWAHFGEKVHRLEQAFEQDKWPKKPSGLCRGWCPVKDCPYWEGKR